MKTFIPIVTAALALAIALPATALGQYPLRATLLPQLVGGQGATQQGKSVAADGNYLVVGAMTTSVGGVAAGSATVYHASTGAVVAALLNPTPAATDNFGYTVAVSGNIVVVGAYQDDTGATDAGSAYVYDLGSATPTVPVLTLNNPAPAAGDVFGNSVAVSGHRVVVGAFDDDTAGTDAGSAYVYDLTSATPTVPVVTLNNPAPATGDNFGTSVAISGTRVVVGAELDDAGATDAGSAYVYDLSGATPTAPVATLNNPGPLAQEYFGFSVAISGSRVVVGAYRDGVVGATYVYDMNSGSPTAPVVILNNPSPASGDNFGVSVSISGTRVVVGAGGNDGPGFREDTGAAYVYELASATPTTPVATLTSPTPLDLEYYGDAVAVSGSRVVVGSIVENTAYLYELTSATPTTAVATLFNGAPGTNRLFGRAVAASGNTLMAGGVGLAYVYGLEAVAPTVPTVLQAGGADSSFGFAVAVSGARAVVGAYANFATVIGAGSARVYDLASATPATPALLLNNPTPGFNDYFGIAVAVSGNVVVVGAYQDDTGATDAGSAYVYDLTSATPTVPILTLNNPSPATSDQFGYSVAVSGTRVAVGANQDDTGATDAGSVYVYDLSSGTPTVPVVTLNNPGPAATDRFGYAAAMSGDLVIVGAPQDDTGAADAGSAYVYDLSSATPAVPLATLNNPTPIASDFFGGSVAISGNRVTVGAYQNDTGASNSGSAYVYDLASATPTVPVTLTNPTPAVSDHFGWSVALTTNRVFVGAVQDDAVNTDNGAAYVFGAPIGPPDAELELEQPANAPLTDGASSVEFGPVAVGGNRALTFTIRNVGNMDLTGLGITIDGPDAAAFAVTTAPTPPVPGPGSTTFIVTHTHSSAGVKTAALHLASNDADENPFDVTFTARDFSTNADLANLVPGTGTLTPAFSAATTSYTVGVAFATTSIFLTPTVTDARATVRVNGLPVASGVASSAIPLSVGSNVVPVAVTAEDGVTVKTYTVNVTRAALAPGNVDPDFNPNVAGTRVRATAVQPDGKTVIVGTFSTVGGQARNNIARLNADSTVESTATFNAGTGANTDVVSVAVQADGKILVGGYFVNLNGQPRTRLARLLANGNVESTATFNAGTGANGGVESIAVQPDGKIVLGGFFTTINGQTRNSIARLNADGTLESTATFNPGTGGNGAVRSVVVQPDGKILLGGFFTSVNGQTRNYLARLHADGTLESTATFNPGTGASFAVNCLALQSDGKILVGGQFATIDGQARNRIARLNADGTIESTGTFTIGTGTGGGFFGVQSLAVQTNGRILLGGDFTTVNGQTRGGIARLHPDGSVESTATFDAGTGVNGPVYSVGLQADGKVLLGGEFVTVNGQPRNRLARLHNDAATQTLAVPTSARVEWLRGGAAPEIEPVTFELSTNGGASWSALGAGVRIAGGWERTGLSLPASGSIRARGRVPTGSWSGCSGIVEQVTPFPLVPEITLEQPNGTPLADGTGSVSFGMIGLAVGNPRTFTIRNTGTIDLTGLGIVIDGTHAADFAVTAAPTAPVPGPSGSTTFTITFTPASAGAKTAALHLASNDADENPYDIALTGTGLSRLESWRLTYFGSTANSGAGADGNDPDRDGLVNVLEFATYRHPTQPGGPIGTLVKNGAVLEFTYQRAKAAVLDGLLFTVEWSDTLLAGSWSSVDVSVSIVSDDGTVQEILATLPGGPGGARFVRLRIDAP